MDAIGWPDAYVRRYREAGYWQDRPLGDFLAGHARTRGDRTALVTEHGSLTYAGLERRTSALARGLTELGLVDGDRVVVQLPNTEDFFVTLFACLRIGAVPVLGLPAYRRSEAVHLARHSAAAAYVLPEEDPSSGYDYRLLADEVREAVPGLRHVLVAGDPGRYTSLASVEEAGGRAGGAHPTGTGPDPTAPAVLLVSGGTTGLPKLIPRTHNDYAYNIRAAAQVCGFDADTVYLTALPAAHNFALACPGALGTLLVGGTVVLAPSPDPDTVFPLVERHRVTVTAVVPPLAALWSQAAEWSTEDISSLALLQVGGARLTPDTARRVRAGLGCEVQQVFGMAEGLLCMTRPGDATGRVDATQGRPLCPDDELRVVDEDDRDVPPGGTGELLTRGPYTLRGYYRAEEHNKTAFTADGFYRTGDLVRLTAEGDVVVEGRKKDLVNRGGDKVSADELEGHLRAHPDILDAAVVPVPDEYLGERTCAWIVPRKGRSDLDVPGLDAFLDAQGVAQYKKPDVVHVTDALPVTGVGKVDKRTLARRAAEASARPRP